jgi:hypothetical protein
MLSMLVDRLVVRPLLQKDDHRMRKFGILVSVGLTTGRYLFPRVHAAPVEVT